MTSQNLLIPLARLDDGPYRSTHSISPEALALQEGSALATFTDPIEVKIEASRLAEGEVLVRAVVIYEATQDCVSCLDPVVQKRRDNLDMVFYHESERTEMDRPGSGDCRELADIGFYVGDHISLDDEIAGFILQMLPEFPRCEADCPGLDPATGEKRTPGAAAKAAEESKDEMEPEWKKQLRSLAVN